MIYLDHNSTTPYSPSVRDYLEKGAGLDWQNPSSIYPQSQVLHQKISECRNYISDFLNCSAKNLFFTSGGTESINTILSSETLRLNELSSIITSYLEHHATLKKADHLLEYHGIKYYPVSNNEKGEINMDSLEQFCSSYPRSLLSFLSANNETGVITDIQAVSKIARKYNCLVHIDAVQSLGKMPIDLEKWDVDFVSFSGHKIGAMRGIGLLYAKKPFAPLMYGGGQERGLRAGTHNFPAIQSLKLAVQDIDLDKQEYVRNLRDDFENRLLSLGMLGVERTEDYSLKCQNINETEHSIFRVNCRGANRLPNTSNIYCEGYSSQEICFYLTQKNVCVSAGSACNTGSPEPSHVITALNKGEELGKSRKDYARSCIRISLASSNTQLEIDYLLHCLKELYFIKKQSVTFEGHRAYR